MKKALNKVMRKLRNHPVSSLSGEELRTYFAHRLENLLSEKRALVRNELEYLLCETGPGNLRIDPEFLAFLAKEKLFVFPGFDRIPEIKTLLNRKEEIEKYIIENHNSPETRKLFARVLGNYLEKLKVVSTNPFILEAVFDNIPVACLIKNNGWILPNTELFSFLRKYQKEKRFPILIAKKISGILFPVFKGLSILGLNTYKIYLLKEAKKLMDEVASDVPLFPDLRYHNQFQFMDKNFSRETTGDDEQTDQIKSFFESTLKNNIAAYHTKFLQSKIEIPDNFIDTVSKFRKNKASKGLIESYQARAKLIQDLMST